MKIKILFLLVVCAAGISKPFAQQPVASAVPQPFAFNPLPLGAIKPTGWLRNQLQIQAEGLTGHLDEFWPDVGENSAWRGGSGEGWERGPYYLDGLLPLAYLLDDTVLIAKTKPWIEWILTHQRADGSIGPEKNKDWWPNMIVLKVLTQYQEATGDKRVVPFLENYFKYQSTHLQDNNLKVWAVYRWAEELLAIHWLYERNHDSSLMHLANQLHDQGFDWRKQFENFTFTHKTTADELGLQNGNNDKALQAHGVNNAMALKMPALWGFFSDDPTDKRSVYNQLQELDTYHLQANGMFSGDEHLAGKDPSQGTELCSVVEAMFSYEQLFAMLGDPMFGDRLEKLTFNALPGTLTADMWAHQYDQQPNQVLVTDAKRNWSSNGNQSNLFGLEPNFGCCTANLHQGFPKFASHLWLQSPNGGLVAAAYAPNEVTTDINGTSVRIEEVTDYPFRENIEFTIQPEKTLEFPIRFRIPGWVQHATFSVNGKEIKGARAGTFFSIVRKWNRGDKVQINFPMPVRINRQFANSAVVERGPLVFSLQIGEDWKKIKDRSNQADDYEIRPATLWNYGLVLGTGDSNITVIEKPAGKYVFSTEGAPVEVKVFGVQLPEWKLVDNSAGPMPASPQPIPAKATVQQLTLIPYGAAKLRVTNFPVVEPR